MNIPQTCFLIALLSVIIAIVAALMVRTRAIEKGASPQAADKEMASTFMAALNIPIGFLFFGLGRI